MASFGTGDLLAADVYISSMRGNSRAARNGGSFQVKNGHNKNARVHDPGPLPPPATYCRHCNEAFPVVVPILGAPPDAEYVRATAQLADHIQRKHPKETQEGYGVQVAMSMAYSAQVVLANFNSTDQGLMEWRDRERHKVFRAMMRGPVSDEKIANQVSALFGYASQREDGPQTPTMEEVILLVKSMRDAIEERHLYPETTPSLISTA
jgi:hypothetical protein